MIACGNEYVGYLKTDAGLFAYAVGKTGATFDVTSLRLEEELEVKLRSADSSYHLHFDSLRQISSSKSFHAMLEAVVNSLLATQQCETSLSVIRNIVSAMSDIGMHRFECISDDFSELSLASFDLSGRKHIITLQFPQDYPTSPAYITSPSIDIDLSLTSLRNVQDMVARIDEEIVRWDDVLSDIDEHCWVIEPEVPLFRILKRRVALEEGVSITVTINRNNPRNICEVIFMGPTSVTNKLKQKYKDRISHWDKALTPRINLEHILEITFPHRQSIDIDTNECGICYNYSIMSGSITEVPTIVCANKSCGKVYHHTCLLEWLQAIPTTKASFDTLFGSCPYCQESITAAKSLS